MRELLFAVALATVPSAAIPEIAHTGLQIQTAAIPVSLEQYPMVHRVDCKEGRGTAFRIGKDHWLSVAHVTALTACKIDGQSIRVTEQDGKNDFARLDTGKPANGLKINCHGFVPGHWYWATGFPFGGDVQLTIAVYATYAKSASGMRVMVGPLSFIPGMSGGAVMDTSGAVVGTVNAYFAGTNISLSRELKNTSICGANIA